MSILVTPFFSLVAVAVQASFARDLPHNLSVKVAASLPPFYIWTA
jgi:hypothetical protein